MVNKKGYIRTIEAVIAIVIILIFIVTIWPKTQQIETKTPKDISLTLDKIISEFQYNQDYRNCILMINPTFTPDSLPETPENQKQCYNDLNNFVTTNLPFTLLYAMSICSTTCQLEQCCIPPDIETNLPKENIYTKSIFISKTLQYDNSKTLKIYVWRKA